MTYNRYFTMSWKSVEPSSGVLKDTRMAVSLIDSEDGGLSKRSPCTRNFRRFPVNVPAISANIKLQKHYS